MKLPDYSLLKKTNFGGTCARCNRSIKYVYTIKDNITGIVNEFGSGCAKKFMDGKTIKEVVTEGIAYDKAVRDEDLASNGKLRVQEFKELNKEMMEYIDAHQDFDFLVSMKEQIEKNGTLTPKQYDVVYGMMLPVAELDAKIKDVTLNIFRVKVDYVDFGYRGGNNTYTLLGETEDHKLVRVYFSSMSEKNQDLLVNKGVMRITRDGDPEWLVSVERPATITVSGSFDGYKLKRVKLS